jgi:hypothetical protein
MALSSSTISAAIAALTISGVTVCDLSSIPVTLSARECPILFPSPSNWKNSAMQGPSTFGTPTTRYWEFLRTYRYVYLHAPAGAGRGISDQYIGLSAAEDTILTALSTLDVAGVDVRAMQVEEYGTFTDPSETTSFFGFIVTITMWETING